ncbi:MAG: hypothetical protein IPJ50_23030 [Betaproteobacteria bacterium]|nr:hypothetical protein [Betaproteobacteria bacterium]
MAVDVGIIHGQCREVAQRDPTGRRMGTGTIHPDLAVVVKRQKKAGSSNLIDDLVFKP